MKTAVVFPGQGSQTPGMGKERYESSSDAKALFEQANEVLGYSLTDIMFEGSKEDLKQTKVTQPAVFVDSVVRYKTTEGPQADMVAGHSLGEFSALVAAGALSFADGLKLVYQRAMAMQEACEQNPSTMAAVLGMDDAEVEQHLKKIEGEVVVAANYNSPGQLVISGSHAGIEQAIEVLKEAGAKRVMPLPVGGAFHSPLMEPARKKLAEAIEGTLFQMPSCPIYQNVDAQPSTDVMEIKEKLVKQLTSPVRWSQTVSRMIEDGAGSFHECGPGKVLQGLVKKINRQMETAAYGA